MAISRHSPQVHAPADFGLGLAVTALLAGLIVLACLGVASVPTEGPRSEARATDPKTTYIDFPAEAPASAPASH